jgi:hypothetical protein
MTSRTLPTRAEALAGAIRRQIAQQPDPTRPERGSYATRIAAAGGPDTLSMHRTDAGWHMTLSLPDLMLEISARTPSPDDALWHLTDRVASLSEGPLR